MNEKKISKIIVLTLSIGLVVAALVSVTYALFSDDIYATNPEFYSTGFLSIDAHSKSENISLVNSLPLSDEEGVNTVPYIFTIKNIGNLDYKFNVRLISINNEQNNTIAPQYIKIKVDDNEVTTLYDVSNVIKSDVILSSGESMDIAVRVWLSIDETNDFYNTPNSVIGKKFESEIAIDGQAVYNSSNG